MWAQANKKEFAGDDVKFFLGMKGEVNPLGELEFRWEFGDKSLVAKDLSAWNCDGPSTSPTDNKCVYAAIGDHGRKGGWFQTPCTAQFENVVCEFGDSGETGP